MKKNKNLIKILILAAIVFILGCNQNFSPNNDPATTKENITSPGYGNVRINIKNNDPSVLSQILPIGMKKFNTRTIMPDLSTDNIYYYDLNGDGPADASFDLINQPLSGSYTINDLEIGDWTITVTGKDALYNVVARGSFSPVTIANGTTANANVTVSPVKTATGTGTIDVSVDWDPAISVSGSASYLNILGDGPYAPLTILGNRLSFNIDVSSDYYTIIISLNNNSGKLLATLVETVYVYDNLTTYWRKSLSAGEINAPPAAPTGLMITEGSGKLILNWNDISNVETGYRIYSKIDPAGYNLLAEIPAGSVGYEDTTATAGNIIDYQIIAYNDFGDSAPLEASYNLAAPTVLSVINPADGATNVDVTTDIKIRFNKSMDPTIIGKIIINDTVSDQTIDENSAYFIFSTTDTNKPNDTLTVIPKAPGPYGKTVSNIRVNGFKDVFGTPTAYADASYDFIFKAAPPKFALGYPRINNITENSFCIDTITDITGKIYYKILPKGAPGQSASEIFSSSTGSYDVTANTLSRKVVTSVVSSQEYDVYIICADPSNNLSSVFKFMVKTPATSDVLFSENFEDEAAPWTPGEKLYIPSGNANSKWDDSVFNMASLAYSKIYDLTIGSNETKKFLINKSSLTVAPSLLGASFNEATKRYTVVEYDFYTPIVGITAPVCHIIASDGTADLNGTGANSIAVHIKVDAAAIGSERIKYVTGEDSDLNSLPDGTTFLTSITWTNLIWYRMQLVLDQSDDKFQIKLLDKTGSTVQSTSAWINYNAPANNIKKVWFGTSNTSELYIDNILIYQTETDPNVSAPTIIINKKGIGPVRQNPFIDVDFIGSADLDSIQYKIGELGPYAPLTTDGTTNVTLSGKTHFDQVKISDTDFNALPEGEKRIYFKVTDIDFPSNSTESVEYFTIIKDTMPPQIKNATIAPDNSFIKLDFSEKVWGDIAMLQAIDTGDLAIAFHHAGSIIDAIITGIWANPALTEPLTGVNGYETVFVQISPVPFDNKPDGTETFSIKSGANMIFDRVGNSGPETTSAIMTFNDKKPPTIVYKSPENSVKAGLDSDLIFTFDEAVNANAGKYIYIKKISDNSTFRSFLATDDTKVVITANQVKLIVDGYFEPNTDYYVTMDAGAFADANGNYSVGITGNTFWKFSSGLNFTEMIKVDGVIVNSYTQSAGGTSFIHNISDFYIGKYEVTYQLWQSVLQWNSDNTKGYVFANLGREGNDGANGGPSPTPNNYEPVTYVSWRDAIVWCNAYSEKMGLTPVYKDRTTDDVIKNSSIADSCDTAVCDWNANGYRLPTEGEWQYAASYKDGSSWTPWNYASGAADATEASSAVVAWYSGNSGVPTNTTHNVGAKQANQLEIYDMSGNILEWCWDWYDDYPTDPTRDDYRGPISPPISTPWRIQRGGHYSDTYLSGSLKVGARASNLTTSSEASLGLRLARSFDETPPKITGIGSPFDGTFKVSDNITIDVTFDENVYIQSGNPTLSLNSGGTAVYSIGSGTKTLRFNYLVKAGENAANLDVTSINLSGSTIKDSFGNDANLTLPGSANLANSNNIAIDTT